MDLGKNYKNLYISFDCEGPFGMYEFINSFKDLSRYKLLDKAISQRLTQANDDMDDNFA